MGPIKAGDTFLFVLMLTLAIIRFAGGQTPKLGLTYCTETSPLDTKYFVPFYESHVPVSGCAARERSTTQPGYQVHVIRINTTSKEVMLHFNENDLTSKGLILVLDSTTAVRWRLSFLGETSNSYKRVLFLSQNSSVHSSNAPIASYGNLEQLKVTRTTPDPQFANIATINWGGLTTFSRIMGANRISISMPKAETLPSTCLVGDSKSFSMGTSVLAYHVTKQTMSGCFHPEVAGVSPSDVHVIDLTSADPEAVNLQTTPHDEDSVHLPAVYLSLSPDQKGSSMDASVSRNLTLILKSQFPVRWYLESWGLAGNLEVISNNGPVENLSLSSSQHLHIVRRPLPEAFDQLWRSVIVDTGSTPVSYVKVELANVLSMVIPPRSKRGLSDIFNGELSSARLVPDANNLYTDDSSQDNNEVEKTILKPGKIVKDQTRQERLREVENTFSSYLVKKCTDTQMIIVTLPLSVTDLFNVTGVRYQEHHCEGTKNKTHWILKTQSTSCGSISYFTDQNPIVRNNVYFKFDQGSELYGSSIRIPIACKFQAGLPGIAPVSNSDDDDDDDDDDITLERIGGGDNDDQDYSDNYDSVSNEREAEMYQMRVFRASPPPSALLMEHPGESATIAVGDKIKIETDFETRSFFNLAIEQCWLTDGSDLRNGVQGPTTPEDPRWLIWQGCPSSDNVTLSALSAIGNYPSFSFRVTDEHYKMKKVYIVCLIGLCTPVGSQPTGNIGKCFDPTSCSSLKDDDHVGPAAQQMSKRGPIFVVDNSDALETSHDDSLPLPTVTIGSADSWQQQNNNRNNHNNNQTPAAGLPESPSLHSSHVVMVGVPAEIAVVIALASFVIGAALTGLLCCVHHRRSMPKGNLNLRVGSPDDPAEGSELQSMITSPSLQPQQPNRIVTT